ncbi:MAG: queuosine precursor transporter [Anaerolineae bacterium]|nr:queuosine precursor transporter [Anaerolineae bacterium]
MNLAMASLLAFVVWLPVDPEWDRLLAGGAQAAFAFVLGPVWRIVTASIVAEVASELLDTEIYHLWVTRVTARYQWLRVLTSNAISVPVDSLIFCWGAFGGVLPEVVVWSIFWSNVLVKGAITLISLPGIYLVPERD